MLRLRIPVILVLAALWAGTAQAQVDTGSILGTIRDKSGAVVPGATVSVREAATNALTAVIADDCGELRRDAPSDRHVLRHGRVGRLQD